MEDWLKCKISPLVKYHQNQTEGVDNYITCISSFMQQYFSPRRTGFKYQLTTLLVCLFYLTIV